MFTYRFYVYKRISKHFYQCIDKKKKLFVSVKIINNTGLKPVQKQLLSNEISLLRRIKCDILPKLKKIYEEKNNLFLRFDSFFGEDLLKIYDSSLSEMAISRYTFFILKGLRSLHSQGVFHGNINLENIIISPGSIRDDIFLINFKYLDEISE